MKKMLFFLAMIILSIRFCSAQDNIVLCNYSSGLSVDDIKDTFYILPGEEFRYKVDVAEMNRNKVIIGLTSSMSYSVNGDIFSSISHNPTFNSGTSYANGEITISGILSGTRITWLANSSATPILGFNLGYFEGVASKGYTEGICCLYTEVKVATKNLQMKNLFSSKVVKKVDRVRGDVDGDGKVDDVDFQLMKNIVDNGLYNPFSYLQNLYTETGLNYGAAALWGSHPDFLSVALCNIYIKNPNDPLVKELRIGEKFSLQDSEIIEEVPVRSYVSGSELVVDAPGADVVDVISYLPDGKVFQASLPSVGSVTVPDPSANYELRAVKFKISGVSTALNKMVKEKINVFHYGSELQISGLGKIVVKVSDINGRSVYSSIFEEKTTIPTFSWRKGLYLVHVNGEVYKIMK